MEGAPLAQKPNLQVLLRCRWAPGLYTTDNPVVDTKAFGSI